MTSPLPEAAAEPVAASASLIAAMTYTHLAVLGWVVFGDLPDTLGLAGMAIVGLAGVVTALRGLPRR